MAKVSPFQSGDDRQRQRGLRDQDGDKGGLERAAFRQHRRVDGGLQQFPVERIAHGSAPLERQLGMEAAQVVAKDRLRGPRLVATDPRGEIERIESPSQPRTAQGLGVNEPREIQRHGIHRLGQLESLTELRERRRPHAVRTGVATGRRWRRQVPLVSCLTSQAHAGGRVSPERVICSDVAHQAVQRRVPALPGNGLQGDVQVGSGRDETRPQAPTSPMAGEAGFCGSVTHDHRQGLRRDRLMCLSGPSAPRAGRPATREEAARAASRIDRATLPAR